jgi:mRNA interferase HigB
MRIISESRIHEWCEAYPDASQSLLAFLDIAVQARWRHLQDLRETYRHADAVEVESERIATVLNIKGNKYRLVVAIHYNTQQIFAMRFMTHKEYDRGAWKKTL